MSTTKSVSLTSIASFALAVSIGILASRYPLRFLYGIEFFFLNAVSWFAYKRSGMPAAFATSFAGAAFGVFLFGQSPLLVLAPVEVSLVHALLRKTKRASLLYGFALYWVPLGLLLHGAAYLWLPASQTAYVALFLLFQTANGLLNALLGEVAGDHWPVSISRRVSLRYRDWSIKRVTFQLCAVLLAVPFAVYLFINGQYAYRDTVKGTADKMNTIQAHLNETINVLSAQDLREFKVHSALQKESMHEAFDNLTLDSKAKLVLTDPNRQVIATSDPAVQDGQEDYRWSNGFRVRRLSDSLYLLQPADIPEYNPIARWSASQFVSIASLQRVPGYQLIMKEPVAPFQQSVFGLYLLSVSVMFVWIFAFAGLALWTTQRISSALTELADYSTGLPKKIRQRTAFEWKKSSIHEVDRLIHNFKDMSAELMNMFQEINENEDKLRLLVHYDSLTGLANRYSFSRYLPALIQESREKGAEAACLFLDLDRFKEINDTLGHEAGDTVLRAVGERLNRFNGERVKSFRLAGDEFVVVLSAPLPDDLEAWAAQVRETLTREPIRLKERSLRLEFSAGIARYPEHGQDAESLLRGADQAMYEAKLSGRNKIKLYAGTRTEQRKGGAAE
ncbi:diguanylate cyclase domain-containing protein [Cohnella caldifontis]|uniref:diguanylate cyclase domain-containing protein n=1 Tax=Cohnella caldifontis TaxID=3027471 RepID=UPI0023EC0F04|nr:diguanylate cyclase [Cohnella sp. YIM B05605]